jgi:hypothetical protein
VVFVDESAESVAALDLAGVRWTGSVARCGRQQGESSVWALAVVVRRVGASPKHARDGSRDIRSFRVAERRFVGRSELTRNRLEIEYPDPRIGPFCSLSGLGTKGCVWSAQIWCQIRQHIMLICRDFTGATGLEPATSGVTGRSWRFRAERGYAGICGVSRALRFCRCGDWRVRPGVSGSLVRDQRGMSSCPYSEQSGMCTGSS